MDEEGPLFQLLDKKGKAVFTQPQTERTKEP
jgi:hypothetical protein